MTMEPELLTYRLSDFMKQIAANQMEELVNKEKMQNEQLMRQDQRSRMILKNKNDVKKPRHTSFKDIMSMKNKDKENQTSGEDEKIKPQKNLRALLGVSRSFRKNIDDS